MICACERNYIEVVDKLLKLPGIDLAKMESEKIKKIILACCRDSKKVIKSILKSLSGDFKIEFIQKMIIECCVSSRNEALGYIINKFKKMIDINFENEDGIFPLYAACSTNLYTFNTDIIRMLLNVNGIDINKKVLFILISKIKRMFYWQQFLGISMVLLRSCWKTEELNNPYWFDLI